MIPDTSFSILFYLNFSTCMKLKLNGVFLPNIFTINLSFFFCSSIASISASKLLNGPSITFTVSPTTKGILIFSSSRPFHRLFLESYLSQYPSLEQDLHLLWLLETQVHSGLPNNMRNLSR